MAKKGEKSSDKRKNDSSPSSTMSLGKRRSLRKRREQQQQQQRQKQSSRKSQTSESTMSNPNSSEYGSQASPIRITATPKELTKVAILGGAGGIGQPLALLLMLHSEYVHHLALYDLVDSVRGVGIDLSHIDRPCKVTTHLGPDELPDAVRGAKVILIPAGLAQRPGMSRDDLFGSNAKIIYNLARVCAQVAPEAMLAIITNPVNSLVPLVCEVYKQHFAGSSDQATVAAKSGAGAATPPNEANAAVAAAKETNKQQQQAPANSTTRSKMSTTSTPPPQASQPKSPATGDDSYRRIFGVTTLDVVRASTLLARSAFYKSEPNGLFKDPSKLQVPVVGGHAGKTILPLLSQATPRLDRKRLAEDKATVMTLIESIQEAGIDVLNAKKGKGSATLTMAYAACRFCVALLRAQLGEANIVQCAYVRHASPIYSDLDYFAAPLQLGPDGYTRSLGVGQVVPFEEQMLLEAARELRLSIAKGEDFAREQLSADATAKANNINTSPTNTNSAAQNTTAPSHPAESPSPDNIG